MEDTIMPIRIFGTTHGLTVDTRSNTRNAPTYHPFCSNHPYSLNMRSFGTEISANRRRNAELSTEQRSGILAALEAKQSITQIAEIYNVTHQTVYNTRDRYLRNLIKSRPRSGRPLKFSCQTR